MFTDIWDMVRLGEEFDFPSDVTTLVGGKGTHVFIGHENAAKLNTKFDGSYYISNDGISGITPYKSWFTAKAWPLNEELQRHILLFQQVSFTRIATFLTFSGFRLRLLQ